MRDEEKAYIIASDNPLFIQRIRKVPPGTKKVYFKQFSLRVSEGSNPKHTARILAGATDATVVDNLQLRRTWMFTDKESKAMRFSYNDIYRKFENLRADIEDIRGRLLKVEMLEEEYIPF